MVYGAQNTEQDMVLIYESSRLLIIITALKKKTNQKQNNKRLKSVIFSVFRFPKLKRKNLLSVSEKENPLSL